MPRRIDPKLTAFARGMRAGPTPMEARMWRALRGSSLDGLKFTRQSPIQGYVCDFVCRSLRLVIEIDGDTHDAARDADRDYLLGRHGYKVLRFTNAEVMNNLNGALSAVLEAARQRPTKVQLLDGLTHPPAPSLGREGEA